MEIENKNNENYEHDYPKDWRTAPLGKLGSFKNGINKGKSDFGFGHPFINLMDVFGISTISGDRNFGLVNSSIIDRKIYDLVEGDVLFIRSSVKPEGVGLSSLVIEDLPSTTYSGFLIRFRDENNLDNLFKKYCFAELNFRKK